MQKPEAKNKQLSLRVEEEFMDLIQEFSHREGFMNNSMAARELIARGLAASGMGTKDASEQQVLEGIKEFKSDVEKMFEYLFLLIEPFQQESRFFRNFLTHHLPVVNDQGKLTNFSEAKRKRFYELIRSEEARTIHMLLSQGINHPVEFVENKLSKFSDNSSE